MCGAAAWALIGGNEQTNTAEGLNLGRLGLRLCRLPGSADPRLYLICCADTCGLGAGTLGRRIALMLATQGGEVRIFGGRAESRQGAKTYVEQRLPEVIRQVPSGSPGRVVLSEDLASAVAGAGLVVESVLERLELKRAFSAISTGSRRRMPF